MSGQITWNLKIKKIKEHYQNPYRNAVCDFLTKNGYNINGILHPKINEYKIGFSCDFDDPNLEYFIEFSSDIHQTESVYFFDFKKNIREKLYKK